MSKLRAIVFGLFLSGAAMPVYAAGGAAAGAGAAGSAGTGAGVGTGSSAPNAAGAAGSPGTMNGPAGTQPGLPGALPDTQINPANPITNPATGQPTVNGVNGVGQDLGGNTVPCNNAGMAASGPCTSSGGTSSAPGTMNALPNSTSAMP